jgi:hypothetical protein
MTDLKELEARLRHLISLNEPRHGGPYQGVTAQACVEAMREAADALSRPASGELEPKALEAAKIALHNKYVVRTFSASEHLSKALEIAIRAYLASLPMSVAGTPEGWRLVPVEPTNDMLEAGIVAKGYAQGSMATHLRGK